MKPYFTILISTVLLSSNYLLAQSVGFYFITAFPVNNYQNFDNEIGYGGNFEFLILSPTQQKPIGIGASLSYLGQGLYFYNDPCDCETYIGNNRANNFINLNLIFQLSPTSGTIRPYLETLFGGSYIYSNTELLTVNYNSVNLYVDDWAWNYGAGGGLKFLLGGDENGNGSMFLDFKGRYMMSTDVYLLDRNSIRYANDSFYYSINKTQINFFSFQIGFGFYFR